MFGSRSHWKGDYVDGPSTPLYPFGHGLSYTSFALDAARLRRDTVTWDETITVDVEVANTGDRAGDEVVQLYVRDPQASVTRPVLELKGFIARRARARRLADVSRSMCRPRRLGFYGRDLDYVVEPGVIEVFVGTSSDDLVHAGSVTITADASAGPPVKAFDGWVTLE